MNSEPDLGPAADTRKLDPMTRRLSLLTPPSPESTPRATPSRLPTSSRLDFSIIGDEGDLIVQRTGCDPGVRRLDWTSFSLGGESHLGPFGAQFAAHRQDGVFCQILRQLKLPPFGPSPVRAASGPAQPVS
jgi:hypothetical protein